MLEGLEHQRSEDRTGGRKRRRTCALCARLFSELNSCSPLKTSHSKVGRCEPSRRGIYGGAVGYVSWQGEMDTAIAIRTAVIKDGLLHVQAGAGVVADSVPELEWEETLSKARAMMRAAAMSGG